MAPSHYFVYREQGKSFQDVAMYQGDSFSVTGINEPEQVDGLDVTETLLPLLGVAPVAGRLLSAEDAQPNAPKAVMIGYGYWMSKFGGDRSVVGRTIIADSESRVIVGVLPRSFHFLDYRDPAIVAPFQFDRSKTEARQLQLQRPRAPQARRHARASQRRRRPHVADRHEFVPSARRFQRQAL